LYKKCRRFRKEAAAFVLARTEAYLLAGLCTMEGFSDPISVITSPFSFAGTFN
jgi:dTDP-4-amino-4,6-dideoxygalactose transaminase